MNTKQPVGDLMAAHRSEPWRALYYIVQTPANIKPGAEDRVFIQDMTMAELGENWILGKILEMGNTGFGVLVNLHDGTFRLFPSREVTEQAAHFYFLKHQEALAKDPRSLQDRLQDKKGKPFEEDGKGWIKP